MIMAYTHFEKHVYFQANYVAYVHRQNSENNQEVVSSANTLACPAV